MRESNEAAEQLLIPPDVVELPETANATLAAALLQGMLTIGQVRPKLLRFDQQFHHTTDHIFRARYAFHDATAHAQFV